MKTLIDAFVVMVFAVFGVYGLSQGSQKLVDQIKTESLKKASALFYFSLNETTNSY